MSAKHLVHTYSVILILNTKTDQVCMWCACALKCGEYNAGGYVGVKGHLGDLVR